MNVNFEAIEKAWFKPKKDELNILEKLEEWVWNKIAYEYIDTSYEEHYQNVYNKIQELKKEMR